MDWKFYKKKFREGNFHKDEYIYSQFEVSDIFEEIIIVFHLVLGETTVVHNSVQKENVNDVSR